VPLKNQLGPACGSVDSPLLRKIEIANPEGEGEFRTRTGRPKAPTRAELWNDSHRRLSRIYTQYSRLDCTARPTL